MTMRGEEFYCNFPHPMQIHVMQFNVMHCCLKISMILHFPKASPKAVIREAEADTDKRRKAETPSFNIQSLILNTLSNERYLCCHHIAAV